jgi:phage FluMu protein Com
MRTIECKKCNNKFVNNTEDKNIICPQCKIQYCNKSDTERFLFLAQDEYLSGKVSKNNFIIKIYRVMISYAQSMLLQLFRNRLHDSEDLDYYSCQACHFFFMYFLEDDNFYVDNSFSGLLFHKLRQAMNEKSNRNLTDFTLDYVQADGSNTIYKDDKKDFLSDFINYENKIYLYNFFKDLIFDFEVICNDKRENFIRLQALHHFLVFGEKTADNLFKVYSRYGKIKYEETLDLLYKEMTKMYENK